jgi:hypothetical protein
MTTAALEECERLALTSKDTPLLNALLLVALINKSDHDELAACRSKTEAGAAAEPDRIGEENPTIRHTTSDRFGHIVRLTD